MHLNGEHHPISLYAINPETSVRKWVRGLIADFDGSLESLFSVAMGVCKQDGVMPPWNNRAAAGIFWSLRRPSRCCASECRIYVYNLALRLGIPVKRRAVSKSKVEVFPRRTRLERWSWAMQFASIACTGTRSGAIGFTKRPSPERSLPISTG